MNWQFCRTSATLVNACMACELRGDSASTPESETPTPLNVSFASPQKFADQTFAKSDETFDLTLNKAPLVADPACPFLLDWKLATKERGSDLAQKRDKARVG